jgi:peptidoglycan/LPS O-acetylase OafA/YrhL
VSTTAARVPERDPPAPPRDPGRNAYIHGLRGVLAFAVFVFHVGNSGLPTFHGAIAEGTSYAIASLEHAVEIFFGISGIVIHHAFLKSRGPLHFLSNRVTRIWPVLWITVLLIAAASRFDARHGPALGPGMLAANMMAMPPLLRVPLINPAAWSIAFEFVFYALFVAYALTRRVLPMGIALLLVAGIALALLSRNPRAIGFLLGLAVIYWPRTRLPGWLLEFPGTFLMGGMLAWHWVLEIVRAGRPQTYLDIMASRGDVALAFFGGSLLVWVGLKGVFLGRGLFSHLLVRPTVQWLGTISFSLYLWSPIAMAPVKKIMFMTHLPALVGPWSQLVFFALSLPPLLWVSALSQRWIEEGLTNGIRRKLRPAPKRPDAPRAASGAEDRLEVRADDVVADAGQDARPGAGGARTRAR